MNKDDYNYLLNLPFYKKLARLKSTLLKLDMTDDDWYISLSGGLGSTVLAHVAQELELEFPCVTVPSCEQPENIRVTLNYDPIFVNGKYSMKQIITKYGYPAVSKQVAMAVSRYSKTTRQDQKEYRLNGRIVDGKKQTAGVIPKKWKFLIYAPFEISEQCCDWRKKKPLKKYSNDNKRLPITGEMASESDNRRKQFIKNGCVQDGKKATPMGYWTENDLKQYIKNFNVVVSKLYDNPNCTRTGCYECMFGIAKDWNRFDRLSKNQRNHVLSGGKWIRKNQYRWVKFRIDSIPIWSNLYWVPSDKGLGNKFVINYIKGGLK